MFYSFLDFHLKCSNFILIFNKQQLRKLPLIFIRIIKSYLNNKNSIEMSPDLNFKSKSLLKANFWKKSEQSSTWLSRKHIEFHSLSTRSSNVTNVFYGILQSQK